MNTTPHRQPRPLPPLNVAVLDELGNLIVTTTPDRLMTQVGTVPTGVVELARLTAAVCRRGLHVDQVDVLGALSGLEALEYVTLSQTEPFRLGAFVVALHPHAGVER